MINLYLYIAFSFFILNGVAYNISIFENNEDPSFPRVLRVAIIYGLMALVWPIELIYLSKLIYQEIKNG
jgi:hypothetical protein